MDARARARWLLLGAAVAFSTGGAGVKATAYDGLQVAGLRSAIGAVVLLAAVPAARRLPSPRALPVVVAYAAVMLSFVVANKLTTAANAIFLQSTFPVWVVLLGPWLLRERVRAADLGALGVMGGGIALLALGEEQVTALAPDPVLGDLVATGAGLFWAMVVMGLRWLARGGTGAAVQAAVGGNVLAAALALALGWPWQVGGPADWLAVLWLGVVQVGLAYVLMTRAVRDLGAVEASLLLLLEPAIAPVWAWLLHGEVPSGAAVGGGVLILVGTVLRSALERRRPVPARG